MARKPTEYIIDGLNICREGHGREARLSVLLSLILELRRKGDTFHCFFDQDAFSIFTKKGADEGSLYRSLSKHHKFFTQVRGIADPIIIDEADRKGLSIITNDTYDEFRNDYPWLTPPRGKKVSTRLIPVTVTRDRIVADKIDINVEEVNDLARLRQDLEAALNDGPDKRSSLQSVKSGSPRPRKPILGVKNAPPPAPPSLQNPGSKSGSNRIGTDPLQELVDLGIISGEIAEILRRHTPQALAEEPPKIESLSMCGLVIAIDRSGSMNRLWPIVIEEQENMIRALLDSSKLWDIHLAQLLFNHEVIPFQPFCRLRHPDDPKQAAPGIKLLKESAYQPSGLTALYDATLQAIGSLVPAIYESIRLNTRIKARVGILTDGQDEGPQGPGTGSKVRIEQLRQVIDFLLGSRKLDRIVLVGAGNADYRRVGREMGIPDIFEVGSDPKGIREAFALLSSQGRQS